jgi:hypothetical protein
MFFQRFPRFYETSEIQASLDRGRSTHLRHLDRARDRTAGEPPHGNVERQGNAARDPYAVTGRMLVGRPTLAGMSKMLDAFGYTIDRLSDWRAILRDNQADRTVRVYAEGRRVTLWALRTLGAA